MAIDEALKCKKTGEAKVIAFNLCDHGYFDMKAYDDHLAVEPCCWLVWAAVADSSGLATETREMPPRVKTLPHPQQPSYPR